MNRHKTDRKTCSRSLTKNQIIEISTILPDIIEGRRADIGKNIDNILSEDIMIRHCEDKSRIKNILLEDIDNLLKQCTIKLAPFPPQLLATLSLSPSDNFC